VRSDDSDLAALIGSRICHDLISPIGAIANGVELLQMLDGPVSPEVALISDSVSSANARIRFFRIAYGHAPVGAILGRDEIARTIDDTYRGSRQRVVWKPIGDLPRIEVKLAFLCLQCLESAMPRGGEITVDRTPEHWQLLGSAEVLQIDPDCWPALVDPERPLQVTSSQVQFAILRQMMADRPLRLSTRIEERQITMRF
jgi:histidine phosphotransferase ChpT